MSIKKILLLASMAVAAIAFAAPASASAEWTFTDFRDNEHKHVETNQHFEQAFEGFLGFSTVVGTYQCEVTVKVTTTGPNSAKVKEFNVTTPTCEGTGFFAGCELANDSNNLGETTWTINLTTSDGVMHVKRHAGDLTIFNEYKEGCFFETSHLEFGEVTLTPTLDGEGTFSKLTLSGTDTSGNVTAFGSVEPENGPTLGMTKN